MDTFPLQTSNIKSRFICPLSYEKNKLGHSAPGCSAQKGLPISSDRSEERDANATQPRTSFYQGRRKANKKKKLKLGGMIRNKTITVAPGLPWK